MDNTEYQDLADKTNSAVWVSRLIPPTGFGEPTEVVRLLDNASHDTVTPPGEEPRHVERQDWPWYDVLKLESLRRFYTDEIGQVLADNYKDLAP